MRATKHVISVSGGKDSTAILLLALNKCPQGSVLPIFCDTGNEHEEVYNYLGYLEQALDIHIIRLKADFSEQIAAKRHFIANDQRVGRDRSGRKIRWSNKAKRRALAVLHPTGNPFLDLCLWKGRFPSRRAQFCTEELKRNIAVEYQLSLIDEGYRVISWQGIRRDESLNRNLAKKFERVGPCLYQFRPIVEWSAKDVFAYLNQHRVQPNQLYKNGMQRVGCMPCINVGKRELRQIDARFPEHIGRIDNWEMWVSMASKRGFSTFFNKELHEKNQSRMDRRVHIANRVTNVVEWAKTTRGGRQYDLLAETETTEGCSSSYGLCE